MGDFKVGEVCIFQNAIHFPQNNGREVTIKEVGMIGFRGDGTRYFGYRLDFRLPNGAVCVAKPNQLLRRKPPATDSGEQAFMQKIRELAGKQPQRQGEPA